MEARTGTRRGPGGPACEEREPALSIEERAASALEARAYVNISAPRGVSEDRWRLDCAEREEFDARHATDFVSLHDAFAAAYRAAYGRRYERGLHSDWDVLRMLVREHNPARALVLIDRAFQEPLLAAAGIDSLVVVLNWAGALDAPKPTGRGSRLTRWQQRLCAARAAERAGGAA